MYQTQFLMFCQVFFPTFLLFCVVMSFAFNQIICILCPTLQLKFFLWENFFPNARKGSTLIEINSLS